MAEAGRVSGAVETALVPVNGTLPKGEALLLLALQAGVEGPASDSPKHIVEAIARLPLLTNKHVVGRLATAAPKATLSLLQPAYERAIPQPVYTNGRPACFPAQVGYEHSPAFEVLALEGGFVAQIARAPAVLACDGATLVTDYSSPYAGLLHGYDLDLSAMLGAAHHIRGSAVVLCDDVHPLNFCHWILDELPRLAMLSQLGEWDVTVITGEQNQPFKRESLALCGFADNQVLRLPDFTAVSADRLLVPRDIAAMPHPAFKAAPWVLNFLGGELGLAALAQSNAPMESIDKLFISRDDGEGRRVVNEAELMRAIAPLGYHRITLGSRTLPEQIGRFARATHVLGPHGAGLSNCAFSPRGARLLEIFPRSYGTPTYYVLMAGQRNPYATYVVNDVVAGSRPQTDDMRVDVADFMRCCGALL